MPNSQILIVEDEHNIAADLKNRLLGFGYDVPVVLVSGEKTIEKSQKIHPDLLLMDIDLHGDIVGIESWG